MHNRPIFKVKRKPKSQPQPEPEIIDNSIGNNGKDLTSKLPVDLYNNILQNLENKNSIDFLLTNKLNLKSSINFLKDLKYCQMETDSGNKCASKDFMVSILNNDNIDQKNIYSDNKCELYCEKYITNPFKKIDFKQLYNLPIPIILFFKNGQIAHSTVKLDLISFIDFNVYDKEQINLLSLNFNDQMIKIDAKSVKNHGNFIRQDIEKLFKIANIYYETKPKFIRITLSGKIPLEKLPINININSNEIITNELVLVHSNNKFLGNNQEWDLNGYVNNNFVYFRLDKSWSNNNNGHNGKIIIPETFVQNFLNRKFVNDDDKPFRYVYDETDT